MTRVIATKDCCISLSVLCVHASSCLFVYVYIIFIYVYKCVCVCVCLSVCLFAGKLRYIWQHFISVSGFGFGVISGAFSLINVLADMTGPGTIGLHGNSQNFFITSGNQ